jgi:hypothetical protein
MNLLGTEDFSKPQKGSIHPTKFDVKLDLDEPQN